MRASTMRATAVLPLEESHMREQTPRSRDRRAVEVARYAALRQVTEESMNKPAPTCRTYFIASLWFFSVGCWIKGAFTLPTLEIHIMPGTPFSTYYRRSLVLTLVDLYNQRSYFAWGALGFCSVCVPSLKLLATLYLIMRLLFATPAQVFASHRRLIGILSVLASYQLLDLYVGVLFVVHFNSDSADAMFLGGFYWYYTYCMASMLMSATLDGTFYEAEIVTEEDLEEPPSLAKEPDSPTTVGNAVRKFSKSMLSAHAQLTGETARQDERRAQVAFGEAMKAVEAWQRNTVFRLPRFIDYVGITVASASFICVLSLCYTRPVIEMRTVWQGVSVDRSIHAFAEIFCTLLPSAGTMAVGGPLFLMNLAIPFAYIASLVGMSFIYMLTPEQDWQMSDMGFARSCCYAADVSRSWATTDVFCAATLVFVFTVQDARTLTMPLSGSNEFYYWLGAGFAMFYLRWYPECEDSALHCSRYLPRPRFWAVLVACVAVCFFVFGGWARVASPAAYHPASTPVLGGAKHYDFNDLASVCANARPLVEQTLRNALPATYGNCTDFQTNPPKPCDGSASLYTKRDGDQFIDAKWVTGLNSIRFAECDLFIVPRPNPQSNLTTYRLTLGGRFEKIKLFLHARQCQISFLGCTTMNSPNHCCGSDIDFNITLDLGCVPSQGFRHIQLGGLELAPLWVDTDFYDNHLSVKALDIAPTVEKLLADTLEGFLGSVQLTWAGEQMRIPQLINRLVAYNAPGHTARNC